MSRPAIILTSEFRVGGNKPYKNYIGYISRKNAVKIQKQFESDSNFEYNNYNNYIANPSKSTGLFTKELDSVDPTTRKKIKRIFQDAQNNNSVLWEDIFSFDNEWLEKNGLYDPKTKLLKETEIKKAVRLSMEKYFKVESLEETGIWTAGIHYNTDNIHVHIATVETKNTRPMISREFKIKNQENRWVGTGTFYEMPQGKRKPKTLDLMKSTFVNSLLQNDKELAMMNDLRNSIIYDFRDSNQSMEQSLIKIQDVKEILKLLPDDRNQWKYNNNSVNNARKKIDKFIFNSLKDDPSFNKYCSHLQKHGEKYKELYGIGDKNFERYKKYAENKTAELYSRLGNSFLRELKKQQDEFEKKMTSKKLVMPSFHDEQKKFSKYRRAILTGKDLHRIKEVLTKDFNSMKNLSEYERLMREIQQ